MRDLHVTEHFDPEAIEARVVRYGDLKPCYNAFIDTRSPGSEAKENFTIIGPGVSENPEQFVHIAEPHGYNIGGARQPPGCVNSQHSHNTAEVFVVHTGIWRFDLGEHGADAQVVLHPGDVISLPTNVFRGFTNVGETDGFLWAVLGEDDPGRVTWAPKVFEMAKDFGLILLESGRLIDTTLGEMIPKGARPMIPTSPAQVAALQRFTQAEAAKMVWRHANTPGETPLIAPGAQFSWPHGFTLTHLQFSQDGTGERQSADAEVIFVQSGTLDMVWARGRVTLNTGDTLTVPARLAHRYHGDGDSSAFIVRRGDRLEDIIA